MDFATSLNMKHVSKKNGFTTNIKFYVYQLEAIKTSLNDVLDDW